MVAPPLSPGELLERADLAGYARVIRVADGRACLWFTRLLKGRPKGRDLWHRLGLSRTATVQIRPRLEAPVLGEWSDEGAYQPGRKILAHLTWNDGAGVYETAWWNAVSRA